jgi:hypothetical protein
VSDSMSYHIDRIGNFVSMPETRPDALWSLN